MTKQETIKMIAVMKAAFPSWGSKLSQEEIRTSVEIWHEMLEEYEYIIVSGALKSIIATKKDFPPSIAEIIEKVQFLLSGGQKEISENEAWAMVRKALGNGMYGAKEEFERLPSDIQSVLREPATLRNWSQLDPTEVDTVVASNFMRSFKEVRKREKEFKALPSDIKQLISNTTLKMIE